MLKAELIVILENVLRDSRDLNEIGSGGLSSVGDIFQFAWYEWEPRHGAQIKVDLSDEVEAGSPGIGTIRREHVVQTRCCCSREPREGVVSEIFMLAIPR